ncbi:MAG: ATP-binding protein [Hyphomonadaceae bacterium]|nr:ATP-binding protein [Hyphomonadaceae bacterium]
MSQTMLDTYLRLPRRRYFSALEWHAVAIGSIAAAVLIIGYGFGFEPLQMIIPGFPTMKARTAAALMALSVSFLMSLRGSNRSRWGSAAVAAVLAVLLAHMWATRSLSTGADAWSIIPSDATIFCLLIGAVTLVVINLRPGWSLAAGVLALVAATPALFRIFGLFLFQGAPDANSPLNTMALHTATLIAWFMLVCVMLHPRLGFGRVVLQASLRGRLLRRALPVVVVLPVVAAAISLALSMTHNWASEALFAVNAAISVTLAALLIWWLSSLVEGWQAEANEQASRLSRANEALEQYASSAAHDLKAPARHVLLYGELLEEALAKDDLATARRHARSIRDSAREMPNIIDGMLDYSRSAFTRITLSENSLSELVQAAARQNAGDLESTGAQITVLHEVRMRCDSTLMTTVFHNLITNAIKNRRRDRPLAVRIDGVRDETGVRISIEDNGVGFDPDFAVVAFNPLARGVHTAGEGTGIGLATCRTIIQSHGGQIRIDPNWRNGARVEFTLPDKRPA